MWPGSDHFFHLKVGEGTDAFLARRAGGRNQEIGQAFEITVAELHRPVPLISQQVLNELGAEHGEAAFYLSHTVFVRAFQRRAPAQEGAMLEIEQPGLLLGQVEVVAPVPQGPDPLPQLLIADDLRAIGRELGREIALQLFALGRRIRSSAISATAARATSSASFSAGSKWLSSIWSKGGSSNGVSQVASNGLVKAALRSGSAWGSSGSASD